MGQLGFTDSILHEDLVPGINFKQETEEKIKKTFDKPVIIYGAGSVGLIFLEYFKSIGIPILAVCDNYKCGKVLPSGEKIKLFSDIVNNYSNYQILIAATPYYYEIKKDILRYTDGKKITVFPNIRYFPRRQKFVNGSPSLKEYREFIVKQKVHIDHVVRLLADNKSKKVLQGVICGRLTDNLDYFNEISEENQYFPSDIIHLGPGEIFIDGGTYTGDTLQRFIEQSNDNFSRAYCFEPGKWQASRFINNYKYLITDRKVILIQKGLWEKSETLSFLDKSSPISKISISGGNNKIEVIAIDEVVPKSEKVTFIKMDIEGSELKALKGAEKTLIRNKPKLAICIYHKPEDIFEIPEYIDSLNIGYKFYIRHHGKAPLSQSSETVLYAI